MTEYKKYKLLRLFHLISKKKYKKKTAKYSTEYRAIVDSGLFNAKWYLKHNPDVETEGLDPVQHYLQYGWKEGRECSPYFDNNQYLKDNPDVRDADMNPLVHWLLHGQKEGRHAVIVKCGFFNRGQVCHSRVIKLFFLIPIYGWKLYDYMKVWSILGLPLFIRKNVIGEETVKYCLLGFPILTVVKKQV